MRIGVLILFQILVLAFAARADEQFPLLKAGNQTYTNITVIHVSATDIFFISGTGAGNIKLKDLDPALQKHFQYDPDKAAAAEKKEAENKIQFHQEVVHEAAVQAANNVGVVDTSVDGKKLWAKSFVNQRAPDLIAEKWLTGQPDLRGKFVLIDFWATWCPPCRAAIPELNSFYEKYGDKLVVIGISDETEAAVEKMTSPHIEYSVAIDTQARTKNTVGVTGIPHVLIIDPHGIVRWEGYPFLKNYELNEKVLTDLFARYSN